jgi:hypothetical protein
MVCFIEVQGFSWEKTFVPKEICVLKNNIPHCFLIKYTETFRSLPAKQRKIVNWATKKYHGLAWGSGTHTIDEVAPQIIELIMGEPQIYTKGQKKADYLSKLLSRHVTELSQYGCPSLCKKEYKSQCSHHTLINAQCAVESAKFLSCFLDGHSDFKKCIDENEQKVE